MSIFKSQSEKQFLSLQKDLRAADQRAAEISTRLAELDASIKESSDEIAHKSTELASLARSGLVFGEIEIQGKALLESRDRAKGWNEQQRLMRDAWLKDLASAKVQALTIEQDFIAAQSAIHEISYRKEFEDFIALAKMPFRKLVQAAFVYRFFDSFQRKNANEARLDAMGFAFGLWTDELDRAIETFLDADSEILTEVGASDVEKSASLVLRAVSVSDEERALVKSAPLQNGASKILAHLLEKSSPGIAAAPARDSYSPADRSEAAQRVNARAAAVQSLEKNVGELNYQLRAMEKTPLPERGAFNTAESLKKADTLRERNSQKAKLDEAQRLLQTAQENLERVMASSAEGVAAQS